MVKIRPFKALRPRNDLAEKIAALPYDVYSRAEAAAITKNDRYTFLRIDRPETQFEPSHDMYAPEVYEKAAQLLRDMEEEGTFVQDPEESYYLYELTMDGRSQTGLVAVSSVDDYLDGIIKKHENTRREKELDRINHVDACNAQTGPIFLSYRPDEVLKKITAAQKEKACDVSFTADDGVTHRIWKVSDKDAVKTITEEFGKMDSTYIADGHHRCASAVRVSQKRREADPSYTGDEEFNYFLSVLFPSDELKIMDYNRVVKELPGYDTEGFLAKLAEKFSLESKGKEAYRPSEKGEMGLYIDENWYKLTVKDELVKDDPVEGLDVAYLQREVFDDILGIKDPSSDKRLSFVGGIRGLSELEKRCHEDCVCAFSMYPTDIEELFAVADAGRLMPPKSTWFEPKLRSGLFIHKI